MFILLGLAGLFTLSKIGGSGRRMERDLRQIKRTMVPATTGEKIHEFFSGLVVLAFSSFMLYVVIMMMIHGE